MWPPRVDRSSMHDRVTGNIITKGNDRVRAFAPVLLDRNNSTGILREVRDAGEGEDVSRVAMRALVRPGEERMTVANAAFIGLAREGEIPMRGRTLMYFGRNSEERRVPDIVRVRQQMTSLQIGARRPKTEGQLLEIIRANGYEFDDNVDERDFQRLLELYDTCLPRYCVNLDSGKLSELFRDPANAFAVIREGGRIIAAAVAEQSVMDVGGMTLHDVEISECVTDPEHRGQGLMSAIIHRLIASIQATEDTVIYSESRAGFPPINRAMRNNGMVLRGWLEKAVVIGENGPLEGPGEFEHMESLNVWALRAEGAR